MLSLTGQGWGFSKLVYGPQGFLVCREDDFVQFVNDATTTDGKGRQSFQKQRFLYNSLVYGFAGLAKRISESLGTRQTILSRRKLDTNRNVSRPGQHVLQGGQKYFTDENHAPVLAAVGVRSSAQDMLKFSKVLLDACHGRTEDSNPLRDIKALWSPYCVISRPESYRLGFSRADASTSNGSGGRNSLARRDDPEYHDRPPRNRARLAPALILSHGGTWGGSSAALYILPETSSAALFDTKPYVDLLPLVQKEAELWKRDHEDVTGLEVALGDDYMAHQRLQGLQHNPQHVHTRE
ncbi:Uu.00g112330.m01.CDS01 [Anthostomella pinea]|uniref:Uu.00g112330.m01.CDS01 n=1 Tax=Anthostomella pinea TaxID=933095 RepID=A0AAI8YGF4_9PEZI|nr:Uu.00g112330.m01.CDS01 [Anthostomella pinea]